MRTYCVTLADMLLCRERRAAKQAALLARFARPLVALSMNIPGDVKNSALIELGFAAGVARIRAWGTPVYAETLSLPTGPEGYFIFDLPAPALKDAAVAAEEQDALGRLLDIDVLDAAGAKLARARQRACLVCGGPGAACARSRAHGLDAVQARVRAILEEYAASFYADAACRALRAEALVTPKPGLVDAANNGAHADMCLSTLLASAAALRPFFGEAVRLGLAAETAGMGPLRRAGLAAEAAMRAATGGVNAHKGAIYALGLLNCAQGIRLRAGGEAVLWAAVLAASDLPQALQSARRTPRSHGERAYIAYGSTGARGEAAAGFPHALLAARVMEENAARGENEAAALALCAVMAALTDTNLLYRGGEAALRFVQGEAKRINALPAEERLAALRVLDEMMIARNLSPGGAADMLAVGLYLRACPSLPVKA